MRNIKTFAFIVSSAVLLAACSSPVKLNDNVKVEDRAGGKASTATTANKDADSRTVAAIDANANANGNANDGTNATKAELAKRSVYFDLDSYIVKEDFKPVVEAHSKYLSGNKTQKVIIQGNTDERGGREYNLALGQKRAEAVRKSLNALGVSDAQMEAVSYGKEKPRAIGSDEAAWTENRRADLVYQ
ncbi:MAG: peptidoglycan-associated lipoprotein Pal [Pseudomonadota bacterium]